MKCRGPQDGVTECPLQLTNRRGLLKAILRSLIAFWYVARDTAAAFIAEDYRTDSINCQGQEGVLVVLKSGKQMRTLQVQLPQTIFREPNERRMVFTLTNNQKFQALGQSRVPTHPGISPGAFNNEAVLASSPGQASVMCAAFRL